MEILRLICLENTTKEIANELSLSSRTVENHRKNLISKTEVKGSVGLVLYAIKNKLFNI